MKKNVEAEIKKVYLTLWIAAKCKESGGRLHVSDVYGYAREELELSRAAIYAHIERFVAAGLAERITARELDCGRLLQLLQRWGL